MGCLASKQAAAGAAAGANCSSSAAPPPGASSSAPALAAAVAAAPAAAPPPPSAAPGPAGVTVLRKARALLAELAMLPMDGSPAAGDAAAAVVLEHLDGVDAVRLTACSACSRLHLHLGAAGLGAQQQGQGQDQQQPRSQLIDEDAACSAARCSSRGGLHIGDAAQLPAERLPSDWQPLYERDGLRSFLATPIVGADAEALGVITLASRQPGAFSGAHWASLLEMAGSGLVGMLTQPMVAGLCELAAKADECEVNFRCFLHTLLTESEDLLHAATRIRWGLKLGLISRQDNDTLLLSQASQAGAAHAPGAVNSSRLDIQHMPLGGTIMAEVVKNSAPRFVPDTRQYITSMRTPARDIVPSSAGQEMPASMAVLPLRQVQTCTAALYVCSPGAPGDFAPVKAASASMARVWQWLLQRHATPAAVQQLLAETQPPLAGASPAASASSSLAAASPGGAGWSASLTAMLKQQVRSVVDQAAREETRQPSFLEGLQLDALLGRGGFGVVYRGTWRGSPAAIKVLYMPQRGTDRPLMKSAMELAVLQELSHPNIVRVFKCFTDMVEESRSGAGAAVASPASVAFRPLREGDPESAPLCNILVMEICDCGDLARAIAAGQLHRRLPDGGCEPDLPALLTVLLEVARSLSYLHGRGIIHCDLKAENVMLKSCATSPSGFTAKLADFGLVKLLGDRLYLRNKSISGTITHVAPERFEAGAKITPALDVYSFGMLLYEAHTGQRPFGGQHAAAVMQGVRAGLRPRFPLGASPRYQLLAQACWAQDSTQRPTIEHVALELQAQLIDALRERAPQRGL